MNSSALKLLAPTSCCRGWICVFILVSHDTLVGNPFVLDGWMLSQVEGNTNNMNMVQRQYNIGISTFTFSPTLAK
jgi:hypothetical protein